MADNKKQPVSFDDIIKAGKQNRAQACAELTTDHTTRPPKAQERAARARHLRQKPSPERSRSWQPQEGTHWRQSDQPSRSKQSKSIPSMIIRLHFADDHISAQLQSLARIARHLATAVVQPGRRFPATTAIAPPTCPRGWLPNPGTTMLEKRRPQSEVVEAASA
jgi:hypothetical protein